MSALGTPQAKLHHAVAIHYVLAKNIVSGVRTESIILGFVDPATAAK